MKPIAPNRNIAGSIFVEASPIAMNIAKVYRGVDLGRGFNELASGPALGSSPSGPYRARAADAPDIAPVPVIVRDITDLAPGDPSIVPLFQAATLARHRLAGCSGPRLLRLFGRADTAWVSVEEFVCGTSLENLFLANQASGAQTPAPIALAIAQGLVALGVTSEPWAVPPSVDPSNVLLDPHGKVRVLPSYREERARQAVGAAVGLLRAAVAYIAPEQMEGEEPDARSVMFTLGLLLYEMLAGVHPVAPAGASMFEILTATHRRDAPPLRQHRPDVHPALSELVRRCLVRDPAGRFATWRELTAAFAGVRALFPPVGSADVAAYIRAIVPQHPLYPEPRVAEWDAQRALGGAGYSAIALPTATRDEPPPRAIDARAAPVIDPSVIYAGADARPMYATPQGLLVDARPVTKAEMERFFLATRAKYPPHFTAISPATDDSPCAFISYEIAEAYARWARKRLPTDQEWEAAVAALGMDRLGVGELWEWTASPHDDRGRVVRGGRWRDQPGLAPRPENRSFEVSAAPDVGFRCVVDAPPPAPTKP